MAEATITDMKNMMPELATVDSSVIFSYLNDAKAQIINEGIAVSNIHFARLHRYLTAHAMDTGGISKASDVASEKVSDVAVSYGGSKAELSSRYSSKWEKLYAQAKISILGLTDRIIG